MAAKKKKYEVTQDFTDLQDKNKVYRKGDAYPKPGNKKVAPERLKGLLEGDNKQGRPVIKEV